MAASGKAAHYDRLKTFCHKKLLVPLLASKVQAGTVYVLIEAWVFIYTVYVLIEGLGLYIYRICSNRGLSLYLTPSRLCLYF